MKTTRERLFLGRIPLTPLAGLMAAWLLSFPLLPEAWIPVRTFSGLLAFNWLLTNLSVQLAHRFLSLP
ncbi:MAG: hypothetical protein JXB85_05455 [Anaerolineales bacterium]|nr:hypothetical protein [Anaerolineales bacterium]